MAAAESNILSWTPANWITVVLMVTIAYVIFGAVARVIQQRKAAQPKV